MTIANLTDLWVYEPPLTNGRLITCPECGVSTPPEDWRECEMNCEVCGTHAACECPNCKESFDHVYGPTFKTVEP